MRFFIRTFANTKIGKILFCSMYFLDIAHDLSRGLCQENQILFFNKTNLRKSYSLKRYELKCLILFYYKSSINNSFFCINLYEVQSFR